MILQLSKLGGVILWNGCYGPLKFQIFSSSLGAFRVVAHWVLDDVTLCVCDFRWGVCVSPFFLFLF